jgi:sulfur transfer complex TusBCD TusB component (DsrH family)
VLIQIQEDDFLLLLSKLYRVDDCLTRQRDQIEGLRENANIAYVLKQNVHARNALQSVIDQFKATAGPLAVLLS